MKIFLAVVFLLAGNLAVNSQIKSVESARAEIAKFSDPSAFSVNYDQNTYLTTAQMAFDPVSDSSPLRKIFSKTELKITAQFAVDGLDKKPVRTAICFISQSKTFRFSRDNELSLNLSGETANLGSANRLSEVKRGKAVETLCWEAGTEILSDLARENMLDFIIGDVQLTISSSDSRRFRDFFTLITVAEKTGK